MQLHATFRKFTNKKMKIKIENKMKTKLIALCLCLSLVSMAFGQNYEFKKLKFTNIDGAPKLSQPQFVMMDNNKPVVVGKMGLAAPALYDWNGNGVKDLLVGEFGVGKKSNIVVFKNLGTNEKPIYSSDTTLVKDMTGRVLYIEGA